MSDDKGPQPDVDNLIDLLRSMITYVRDNATSPSKIWKFLDNVEADLPASIQAPTNLSRLRASQRKVTSLENQLRRLRKLMVMHAESPETIPEEKLLKGIRNGLNTMIGQRGSITKSEIDKVARTILEELIAQWPSKKDSS